jgi:hypothetical protein
MNLIYTKHTIFLLFFSLLHFQAHGMLEDTEQLIQKIKIHIFSNNTLTCTLPDGSTAELTKNILKTSQFLTTLFDLTTNNTFELDINPDMFLTLYETMSLLSKKENSVVRSNDL